MTLLTALEIHSNYPENILITTGQIKKSGKWLSQMYLLRENEIHKMMLSFDINENFDGFETQNEAKNKMELIANEAIEYINNKK